MVTLHKYCPAFGLPDMSPFCIKVETYLRMAGVPFTPIIADGRKAPKQKLPYVTDGGAVVCDSRDIIAHFEAKLEAPLDAGLSAKERAVGVAFRALLEEEVYFYALYQRWQLDEGWKLYVPVLREYGRHLGMPGFLVPLLLTVIRKQVVRDAWGQGTGRHTREQVDDRLCSALDAVATQFGDGPYFFGDRPRTLDASLFAFLWPLMDAPFETRARAHARSLENLAAYVARMRAAYFPATGEASHPPLRVVGSAA